MQMPTPDRSGFLNADGHTIYWEMFGEEGREVICLLNGLTMHTGAWHGFLPRLLPHYRVLLWDYPGQGQSSTVDTPYYLDRFAGYLQGILDESGIARIYLMGISYGGFVALEFARLFQSRLHTLTLSGIILSHETLFELYEALSLRFYRGGAAAFELGKTGSVDGRRAPATTQNPYSSLLLAQILPGVSAPEMWPDAIPVAAPWATNAVGRAGLAARSRERARRAGGRQRVEDL